MHTYLTEIITEDGTIWCGPDVRALTPGLAKQYLNNNSMGYAKVIGELICKVDKDGNINTQNILQ